VFRGVWLVAVRWLRRGRISPREAPQSQGVPAGGPTRAQKEVEVHARHERENGTPASKKAAAGNRESIAIAMPCSCSIVLCARGPQSWVLKFGGGVDCKLKAGDKRGVMCAVCVGGETTAEWRGWPDGAPAGRKATQTGRLVLVGPFLGRRSRAQGPGAPAHLCDVRCL
jgi:hypothetical protein